MDKIVVTGNGKLNGVIPISGAKNAALPLMIASLLTTDALVLENVPHLADTESLIRILTNHGVDYQVEGKKKGQNGGHGRTIHFRAGEIVDTTAPYELVSRMRASFWVIGPLLARMHEARVSLPGGCAIGTRPVDLFLESLSALGAVLDVEAGYIVASAKGGLKGAGYRFPKVSVGATHVAMMAASLAKGQTILDNAAREPEIEDLAKCLNAMGAKISGAGTATIVIDGVDQLHGARHSVLPDRIEAGTFAIAAAMTGGDVLLEGAQPGLLQSALDALQKAGVDVETTNRGIRIARNGSGIKPVDVTTEPFPGFPTDLQAQFMALMTRAEGVSHVTETIFENRFMHVQELARLGARIGVDGKTATVTGVPVLKGAPVMATDLRASVSLVIAGLVADGDSTVSRVYHLDRGFERLEEKLSNCGAKIERISA
ncbi:MAG TPA: UDP-N-acetylglucosamine 1-carboxyvinyltransferase [Rhizobiaceae bacterium]|nr:UDP-N-acetylglucosamine 1-carboxyvinyltransferase [Rhizobiaceae bacterium]